MKNTSLHQRSTRERERDLSFFPQDFEYCEFYRFRKSYFNKCIIPICVYHTAVQCLLSLSLHTLSICFVFIVLCGSVQRASFFPCVVYVFFSLLLFPNSLSTTLLLFTLLCCRHRRRRRRFFCEISSLSLTFISIQLTICY